MNEKNYLKEWNEYLKNASFSEYLEDFVSNADLAIESLGNAAECRYELDKNKQIKKDQSKGMNYVKTRLLSKDGKNIWKKEEYHRAKLCLKYLQDFEKHISPIPFVSKCYSFFLWKSIENGRNLLSKTKKNRNKCIRSYMYAIDQSSKVKDPKSFAENVSEFVCSLKDKLCYDLDLLNGEKIEEDKKVFREKLEMIHFLDKLKVGDYDDSESCLEFLKKLNREYEDQYLCKAISNGRSILRKGSIRNSEKIWGMFRSKDE